MAEVSLKIDLDDAQAKAKIDALNAEILKPRAIPVAAAETAAGAGGLGGALADIGGQLSKAKGLFGQVGGAIGDLSKAMTGSSDAAGRLAGSLPRIVGQIGQVVDQLSKAGRPPSQPFWLQLGTAAATMFGPIGTAAAALTTTIYNAFTESDRQAEANAAAERERQAELNKLRQETFEKQWAQYQQLNKQISSLQLEQVLNDSNLNASPSTDIADAWARRQTATLPDGLTAEEKNVEQQRINLAANSKKLDAIAEQIAALRESDLALAAEGMPGARDIAQLQARRDHLQMRRTQQGGLDDLDTEELENINEWLQRSESEIRNRLAIIGVDAFTGLEDGLKTLQQASNAYTKQLERLTEEYNKIAAAGREQEEALFYAEAAEEEANNKRLNELLKESRPDTLETRAAEIQEKAVERYNSLMRLGLGTDEASEATVGWLRNQNAKNKQVSTYSGVVASELASVGGGGQYSAAEIQTVTQSDSDRLLTRILSVLTASKDLQAKFLEQDFDAGAILY